MDAEETIDNEVIAIIKDAEADGTITKVEFDKLLVALHRSKYKGDEDPRPDLDLIFERILDKKFNSDPIEDTKETDHEED